MLGPGKYRRYINLHIKIEGCKEDHCKGIWTLNGNGSRTNLICRKRRHVSHCYKKSKKFSLWERATERIKIPMFCFLRNFTSFHPTPPPSPRRFDSQKHKYQKMCHGPFASSPQTHKANEAPLGFKQNFHKGLMEPRRRSTADSGDATPTKTPRQFAKQKRHGERVGVPGWQKKKMCLHLFQKANIGP